MKSSKLIVASLATASAASAGAVLGGAAAQVAPRPLPTISLKNIPVREAPNIAAFLNRSNPQARTALKQLGKALFWDMRVSSDNSVACATCHFNAGGDNRSRNQLEPGSHAIRVGAALPGSPDVNPITGAGNFGNTEIAGVLSPNSPLPGFGFGTNYQLTAQNFPLHRRFRPTLFGDGFLNSAQVSMDTNDIVSSQGVRSTANDPLFNSNQVNVRRVAGRNAPPAINAAFAYDQFWDGRGRFIFNGATPLGFLDRAARVKRCTNTTQPNCAAGAIELVKVSIPFGQHASQSVGPPLSDREMSGHVRDWPALGAKLLRGGAGGVPLAIQQILSTDSVLGPISNAPSPGATKSYKQLVIEAIAAEWRDGVTTNAAGQQISLMESNFPLIFGLALASYQNILIADDTPLDRFLGSAGGPLAPDRYPPGQVGAPPNPNALTAQQQRGLQVFQNALCIACHALPVTSNATANLAGFVPPLRSQFDDVTWARLAANGFSTAIDALGDVRIVNNPNYRENFLVPNAGIEAMPMVIGAPGQLPIPGPQGPQFLGVYDVGFYNISRRPTEEDIGRGNSKPTGVGAEKLPLSYTELSLLKLQGKLPRDVWPFMPDRGILCDPRRPAPVGAKFVEVPNTPIRDLFTISQNRTVVRGTFKVPNLRNQQFLGPYFHDGGDATLRHVVEFYTRGGNFPITNQLYMTADIAPIPLLDVSGAASLAARLQAEQNIRDLVSFLSGGLNDPRVAGGLPPFDHPQLYIPTAVAGPSGAADKFVELPATGRAGGTPPQEFLGLDPQSR